MDEWDMNKINAIMAQAYDSAYKDGLNDALAAVQSTLRCYSCTCYGEATAAILDVLQLTKERDSQTDNPSKDAGGDRLEPPPAPPDTLSRTGYIDE